MIFRKSNQNDIKDIIQIINQAQDYFKMHNIDQWQDGYPNEQTIYNDIVNGYSYVLCDKNNILATAAVSFDGESSYNKIYKGNWVSNANYAVVHRIAVKEYLKGKGLSSIVLKDIVDLCISNKVYSIRIDTHNDNLPMQTMLKKNNFIYCGIIYLEDKSERIAFEKILKFD